MKKVKSIETIDDVQYGPFISLYSIDSESEQCPQPNTFFYPEGYLVFCMDDEITK
jgi:hypothetical protein